MAHAYATAACQQRRAALLGSALGPKRKFGLLQTKAEKRQEGSPSFSRFTKKPFSPGPVPGKGKRLPGRAETQNDHAATITGKATYKSWQKKKNIDY